MAHSEEMACSIEVEKIMKTLQIIIEHSKSNQIKLYLTAYVFNRPSTIKIGVERVNQARKLTRTEVNNIVDVAVNCAQIVEQILA